MSKKKLIAILTLMCFMFTLVPVTAMAEESTIVTVTDETSLKSAIERASKTITTTINVVGSVTLSETLTIDGKNIILQGGGTIKAGDTFTVSSDSMIVLENAAVVIVQNITLNANHKARVLSAGGSSTLTVDKGAWITGGGKVGVTDHKLSGGGIYVTWNEAANIYIKGGEISGNTTQNGTKANGNVDEGQGGGIHIGNNAATVFEMTGGEISGNKGGGVYLYSYQVTPEGATVGRKVMTGGTVTGNAGYGVSLINNDLVIGKDVTIANNDTEGRNINLHMQSGDSYTFAIQSELKKDIVIFTNYSAVDKEIAVATESYIITENDVARISVLGTDNNGNQLKYGLKLVENKIIGAEANIVTFKANDMADTIDKIQKVLTDVETNLIVNGFTREGYSFSGWNTEINGTGDFYADEAAVTFTDDVTLYAQWTPETYNITYKSNGGTNDVDAPKTHTYDTATTLKGAERDGYDFDGWYTDEALTQKVETLGATDYTDDITLYAKWNGHPYTIRFNGNGGTSATTMSAVMYYGETEALPANPFTNPGFNFAGWALSLDGEMKYADNAEVTIDTPVANDEMTLYALWTAKEVISAFEELSQAYEYDGNVKAYVIEFDLDGFTIAYKQGDEVIAEPKEIGSYDVVISRAEDDTYAAFNQTIENGLVITEPDETEDEYIPSSSSSSGFSGSYNYPVSTSEVNNGDVKLSDSNAVEGESVTATVTPDNGYGVAEVIVTDEDGNIIPVEFIGNGQYTFVMPDGEVSVEVVCKPAITMKIGDTELNIFGKIVKNDVAPIIGEGNRTMLPIRAVANALGADVYWDADNQKVTIVKDGKVIEVFIGKDYAFVDGERIQLDAKAYIENDRTYLQVRFVTEALDAEVIWDPVKRMITIIPN